jgi:hypothetical protein
MSLGKRAVHGAAHRAIRSGSWGNVRHSGMVGWRDLLGGGGGGRTDRGARSTWAEVVQAGWAGLARQLGS